MSHKRKYYMLGVSILALSSAFGTGMAQAQTCSGAQTRTATCLDYRGNATADGNCTSNGVAQPALSQTCTYSCPPPPPPPGGGDGGDGDGATNYNYHGNSFTIDHNGVLSGSDGTGGYSNTGDGDGDGDGGGSSSSVLCTYFHNKGEMPEKDYYAGFVHAMKHLNKYTWRGYHAWAVPYVQYMVDHPNSFAEKFIRPCLFLRAEEISYQLGLRSVPNYKGKLVRLAFEGFSFAIGLMVEERDYTKLYTREQMANFARKFREYEAKEVQKNTYRDPTAMLA